jgi:hypothetical protein
MSTKKTSTKLPQDWVITVPAKRVEGTQAAIKRAVERLKSIDAEIEETGGQPDAHTVTDMYLLMALIVL